MIMRLRFLGVSSSGGEYGVAGVAKNGAIVTTSSFVCSAPAPTLCEAGGVLGVISAVFCSGGLPMLSKKLISSPRRELPGGLLVTWNRDVCVKCVNT